MARKQTFELAQREGMERIVAAAVSKVGVLVGPWILLGLIYLVGAFSHWLWGKPPAATWMTLAGTLCTVALTLLVWAISHHRGLLGRWHSTLTCAGAGLWFVVANITGVWVPFVDEWSRVTVGLWFMFGGTLALGWNFRTVIRNSPSESAGDDPLRWLFTKVKAKAGLEGADVRTQEATEHKVQAELDVPDGKTVDDVQKKVPALEAAAGVPSGTFQVAPNVDNAGKAHFITVDPRTMRRPIRWPGPYLPGRSMGDPLRPGLWQDMEPVLHTLPGHHVQMMGMSGAGKSIGGAWNYLAEIITRFDGAVLAADITKGEQTLGPLRPALHRFETTAPGARSLLYDVRGELQERTNWLAARGFQKWVPGCGLTYWIIWWEEFPDIYDTFSDKDEETFKSTVRTTRSGGASMFLSLQRSDFTQMPTFARGQLAKMCFGVADDYEASFGLSDRQKAAGASPELWQNHPEHQGKAYLDAPSIPEEKLGMGLRTWSWGKTDQEAHANITAHAEAWPAASKTVDEFTKKIADASGSAARPSAAIPMPPAAPERIVVNGASTHAPKPVEDGIPEGQELLERAAELVINKQRASTAMLQRGLRLSHEDCVRVMEALERKGIVGPLREDETREVKVAAVDLPAALDELHKAGDAVAEYAQTDDPDPTITAGPDDEIPDLPPAPRPKAGAAPKKKMSPEAARGLVEDWIRHRFEIGELSFTASDEELRRIRDESGNTSRSWAHNVLMRIASDGLLEVDNSGPSTVFRIVADRFETVPA
ncbi:DNA translocase FtsK [Actinomadura rudentiformis]|uniref:FtsK gamma domain-containing protein n=1 Tax=Actinomadura rudentiformis TaxID=359158 RepID=A0A6H9YUM9_9ACTN|nr:DNA translocase FtsK [Actinomadura rudentiformis]KAB2347376.1 hypothetical protein F8566_20400 [Actinomadura rudentiformis]